MARNPKFKRHIVLPVALAVYAVIMAVIAYPNYQDSDNMREYWLIISVSLLLPVLLHFVLKRREKNRERFREE